MKKYLNDVRSENEHTTKRALLNTKLYSKHSKYNKITMIYDFEYNFCQCFNFFFGTYFAVQVFYTILKTNKCKYFLEFGNFLC